MNSCSLRLIGPFTFFALLISLAGSVLITPSVVAGTLKVCRSGCDFDTIQGAIDYAQWGDTIRIARGVYTEDIHVSGKSLKLVGESQPQTVIHGTGSRTVVLLECTDASAEIKIERLTITGGNFGDNPIRPGEYGGGIVNPLCTLTVNDVMVYNNRTFAAGGGIATGGPTVIKNSILADNVALRGAGGINSGTSLTVVNSTISRSSSGCAVGYNAYGSIYSRGNLVVRDSVITDARLPLNCGAGGGINHRGNLLVVNSTIARNAGVGIYSYGPAEIKDTLIIDNTFECPDDLPLPNDILLNDAQRLIRYAGGISHLGGGRMIIASSVVLNNKGCGPSGPRPGGIANSGTMIIKDTNVTRNQTYVGFDPCNGGGIGNAGDLTLQGVIINENTAYSPNVACEGGGIYNFSGGTITAKDTIIENNLPDNCAGVDFTCP